MPLSCRSSAIPPLPLNAGGVCYLSRNNILGILQGESCGRKVFGLARNLGLGERVLRQPYFGELDADLVAFAGPRGLDLIAVGPRTVIARISSDIASRARWAGAVGTVLLLVWLVAMLRSARALVFLVIPAAAGLIVASLLVQAAFGSLHVLALGFGGALMGLALDYPLHLMTHARGTAGRDTALRWIPLFLPTLERAFGATTAQLTTALGVGERAGNAFLEVGADERRGFVGGEETAIVAQGEPRTYANTLGALVVHHPQDPAMATEGCVTESHFASKLGLPGIHPMAERMMLARDMALVEITGARYHADQITTRAALDVIRDEQLALDDLDIHREAQSIVADTGLADGPDLSPQRLDAINLRLRHKL